MPYCVKGKNPALRNLSYLRGGSRFFAVFKLHPHLCDLVLLVLATGMLLGFVSYFGRFWEPLQAKVEIDLSPLALPKYAFYSMSRGLLGYVFSLAFSLVWGILGGQRSDGGTLLNPWARCFAKHSYSRVYAGAHSSFCRAFSG